MEMGAGIRLLLGIAAIDVRGNYYYYYCCYCEGRKRRETGRSGIRAGLLKSSEYSSDTGYHVNIT